MSDEQRPQAKEATEVVQHEVPVRAGKIAKTIRQETEALGNPLPQDGPGQSTNGSQNVLEVSKEKMQIVIDRTVEVADHVTRSTGDRLTDAAGRVRQRTPSTGAVAPVTGRIASGLEQSGAYLHEQGAVGLGNDLKNLSGYIIPWLALLGGLFIGFLLGRQTEKRSDDGEIKIIVEAQKNETAS